MSFGSEAYLEFLGQVENALADALREAAVPPGDARRNELETMYQEVAETRVALLQKQAVRRGRRPEPLRLRF